MVVLLNPEEGDHAKVNGDMPATMALIVALSPGHIESGAEGFMDGGGFTTTKTEFVSAHMKFFPMTTYDVFVVGDTAIEATVAVVFHE